MRCGHYEDEGCSCAADECGEAVVECSITHPCNQCEDCWDRAWDSRCSPPEPTQAELDREWALQDKLEAQQCAIWIPDFFTVWVVEKSMAIHRRTMTKEGIAKLFSDDNIVGVNVRGHTDMWHHPSFKKWMPFTFAT